MKYYMHVLDYSQGAYINIALSEELSNKYEKYENWEDFVHYEDLDKKYGFRLQDSYVMICDRNTMYYK